MLTNLIQVLHTTAAYQSAAFQLMAGEAGWAARQLGLPEALPITAVISNKWSVSAPPWGVGGEVVTSNYVYSFQKGRLIFITKREWANKISPPLTNITAWAGLISLIDTNGAYQLATQWLGSLLVDVGGLERKTSAGVRQNRVLLPSTNENSEAVGDGMPIPIFNVNWSREPQSFGLMPGSVAIKLLGTTRELLQLRIGDASICKRAPLQLANAAALLGPLPAPRHFVEDLLGGSNAYETVRSPDRLEAWLLNGYSQQVEHGNKQVRTARFDLKPANIKLFSDAVLDFDAYAWGVGKLCSPDYGLRLRFRRGKDVVEILFCYDCDILQITHEGRTKEENFDFAHNKLVKAIQRAFPKDEVVRTLKVNDEKQNRDEYQSMLKSFER